LSASLPFSCRLFRRRKQTQEEASQSNLSGKLPFSVAEPIRFKARSHKKPSSVAHSAQQGSRQGQMAEKAALSDAAAHIEIAEATQIEVLI
jgi:hypothetical protein